MKRETIRRVTKPTGILIGLPEPLGATCEGVLAQRGIRVLRVSHVAAACERIPVTMPELVVVPARMHPDERDMLVDRCVAVGASVLEIGPSETIEDLAKRLEDAADMALVRAMTRA